MIDLLYIFPAAIIVGMSTAIIVGVFGLFDFLHPARTFFSKLLTCEVCTAFWAALATGTALVLFSEVVQERLFFIILAFSGVFAAAVIAAILAKPICRGLHDIQNSEKPKKTNKTSNYIPL